MSQPPTTSPGSMVVRGARPALVFRLPRSSYLIVLALAVGVTAVVQYAWLAFVYVIPLVAAFYIARLSTRVDADGITVTALAGRRRLPWDSTTGLTVVRRNVYAVLDRGMVRLPCVRIGDLHALAVASGGRLPALARPVAKYAPSRPRRR